MNDDDDDLWEADDGIIAHDVWIRLFEDSVTFQPTYLKYANTVYEWDYAVSKFPFVPGFHVCEFDDDGQEYVLSTHKTLHEAMDIVKILLASGGVRYV